MSRDYKHRVDRRRKKASLPPLVGVLGGLVIGLFVAFLVYIKMQAQPPEAVYRHETLPPAASSVDEAPETSQADSNSPQPPPKPRFDFYTLLPEMEVVIPEAEITESRKQPPPPALTEPAREATAAPVTAPEPAKTASPPPAATGTYFLQVGSFRNGVQAERFKAELGMMGLQTSIQKVTINNTDTYHRVRVGPFGTLDELDKTRQTLRQKGIDSTPIKVRG
jgi:cell division protein FtsN